MKKSIFPSFLTFLFLFIVSPLHAALPNPEQMILTSTKGGHKVSVSVKSIPFNKAKHSGEKNFVGSDGGTPATEFESIKVSLDGKEIPLNKKWYEDLYNPNVNKENFKIALGDDLKTVWAYMSGSDAAGSYGVLWVFPLIGPPSRIVSRSSDSNLCDTAIFEETSKAAFHEVK